VKDPTRKVDRDEVFLEYTKSVCPVCRVVLDAEVNVRDGRVYLRKRCPEHGPFEALVYSDAEAYVGSARFNRPGTFPLETQTEVREGCPLDCGLCPEHKQHACLGVLEVNSGCNLDCPVCFAGSGHQPDGFSLTVEQVEAALDAFVRAEGEPEVVMLSGGEPTIHPRILDFLRIARAKGIRHVMLNTNGVRLARDPAFVAALAELRPTIYLQFDGFRERTHRVLRGRDLRATKERALDRCAEAGLPVALVAAVDRGLNDDELGAIVRFGIAHPAVRAAVFQPVTHAGRHPVFDPRARLTNADVIRGLVEQMAGALRPSDFFPVPCCFPSCRSVTYLLAEGETIVPIPRLVDIEEHLDYVTNRVLPDPAVRTALEALWSASAVPGAEATAGHLACATCAPGSLDRLVERAFMIVTQDFQDPYTLNVRQLMKCCVVELVPDGRLIPFCAFNSVGYREQVRTQLSGTPVPLAVPNAQELGPLVARAPQGYVTAGALPRPRDARNVGRRLP
jgi:uncharacterized radical SAM superfamily Fe-S cluster-containing enzyme